VVEGTIVKRRAMGRQHGVILLAESLAERFDPEEVAELQDVDRDVQGNIRVAEIDLGRKVKSEVQARLERRGIKVTLVDKTIGYELRCAPPIPIDAEYARDLGYAAFRCLHGGGTMVTIQGGEFRGVPFGDVLDPETGRGRQRPVDVDTESYQVARDYMVRIGRKDFDDAAWVATLADSAGLPREEFVARFGSNA
jgi:6-phosphofructokinase 1